MNKAIMLLKSIILSLILNGVSSASVIDFEIIPGTGIPSEGLLIDTQFVPTHGISFSLEDGTSPVVAEVGSPGTAFLGPPNHSTDDTPAPNQNVGSFFLTNNGSITAGGVNVSPLIINYNTPTTAASGVILDIDLSETWTIEARNNQDNVLATVILSESTPNTGDGIATQWSIDISKNEIYSLRFVGSRITPGGFGLAFDNFDARSAAIVPIPGALWLFSSGILVFIFRLTQQT